MQNKIIFFISNLLLFLFLVGCQSNPINLVSSTKPSVRSVSSSSSTATLHAIIVADTNDISVGSSVKVDLKNIKGLVTDIQRNTGLRLNQQTISGNQVNYQNIMKALNGLSVSHQDMIFFYYAGHGYNRGKGSIWPTMKIGSRGLDLDDVKSTLKNKKPRFLIAMTDACNSFLEKPMNRGLDREEHYRPKAENYRRLFLNTRGYIVASSTSPDQEAIGDSVNGGLFTKQFLNNLEKNLASSNPSWRTIAAKTEKTISYPGVDGSQQQQDAQFEVEIEQTEGTTISSDDSDDSNGYDDSGYDDSGDDEEPPIQEDYSGGSFDETSLSLRLLPSARFQVGESMQIKVTNQGANNGYLFVWDINSEGKLAQILPNEVAKTHRLSAGQTLKIPEHSRAGFSLTMTEPRGNGFIVALLVDSNDKQKVLSENLESSISATQAQSALQALRERLSQILNQSEVSFTKIDYEIF